MPSRLLFWDVDTQFDFMHPAGKLYVPGAETIISNLQRLTAFAAQHAIPIVASTDAHLETDPEFREYPPHCLAGTPGQKKVEGTLFPHPFIIPNRKIDLPGDLGCYPEIILEKQTVDVFTNPNTDSVLNLLGDREIILYGVVTEICVDRTARGLILHGATEAYRAEFQKKRKPGMHRTATMIGVDTYRPLVPTAEFARMAG